MVPPSTMDISTYDLFYIPETLKDVIASIQQFLQDRIQSTLEEFHESHPEYTLGQIIEALNVMMETPIRVHYHGRHLFVVVRGEMIFLVGDRSLCHGNSVDVGLVARASLIPAFYTPVSPESLLMERWWTIRSVFSGFFKGLLDHVRKGHDEEAIRLWTSVFPSFLRDLVIEETLRALNQKGNHHDEIFVAWTEWLAQHGLFRSNRGEWVYQPGKEKKKKKQDGEGGVQQKKGETEEEETQQPSPDRVNHDDPAFLERYVHQNPIKIYGFMDGTRFKIRDVSETKHVEGDGKKKTRGQACTSYRTSDLMAFLWRLGVRDPREPDKKNKIPIETIHKELKDSRIWLEFVENLTKTSSKKENEERLRFTEFFGSKKKPGLCTLLLQELTSHGLLVPPPLLK